MFSSLLLLLSFSCLVCASHHRRFFVVCTLGISCTSSNSCSSHFHFLCLLLFLLFSKTIILVFSVLSSNSASFKHFLNLFSTSFSSSCLSAISTISFAYVSEHTFLSPTTMLRLVLSLVLLPVLRRRC